MKACVCPELAQVPDVDAVIHFDDVAMANLTVIPDSPPLFSYGSNAAFAEVPFPDWTYWGSTGPSQQRTWQVKRLGRNHAYRTFRLQYQVKRRDAAVQCRSGECEV